jgi:hypothetical protein
MTDAEIFDRRLADRGGRLKREAPDFPKPNGYPQIVKVAQVLIGSAQSLLPKVPRIHFDIWRNAAPNAVAFKESNMYYIGLTSGAVYLLTLVFTRMLADARLFPDVGNPAKESDDLPPLGKETTNSEKMFQAGFTPIPPRDESRLEYAMHLRAYALHFLVGHEIAHITLGHVDYLNSINAAALIEELGWVETDPDRILERQCLEANADMRSTFSGIQSLRETRAKFKTAIPHWGNSPRSVGRLIFDWAVAVNTLFRLFGDVRFSPSDLATNPYPPLPLRRLMAMRAAFASATEHWNQALKEKAKLATQIALKHTEHAFATILGGKIKVEGLKDADGQEARVHITNLFKRSLILQKRLAPFSYEGLFKMESAVPKELG